MEGSALLRDIAVEPDDRSALDSLPQAIMPQGVDRATIAALIARELPKLRRFAMMLVRDREQANDLVQDTLVRVLTYAHHWRADTNFGAWVKAIMRNQFYTGCNKRRREAGMLVVDDNHDTPIAANQEDRIICNELTHAIGRLPPKQRVVVSLVAFEGLSSEEIALRMDITANAVRCHLMRGRKQLRDAESETRPSH